MHIFIFSEKLQCDKVIIRMTDHVCLSKYLFGLSKLISKPSSIWNINILRNLLIKHFRYLLLTATYYKKKREQSCHSNNNRQCCVVSTKVTSMAVATWIGYLCVTIFFVTNRFLRILTSLFGKIYLYLKIQYIYFSIIFSLWTSINICDHIHLFKWI